MTSVEDQIKKMLSESISHKRMVSKEKEEEGGEGVRKGGVRGGGERRG